jgi:GTP-binding protein EngB required for normal cell division
LPAVTRVVVATKIDKVVASKRKPALEAFKKASGIRPLGFSAVSGEGRDELWARVRTALA